VAHCTSLKERKMTTNKRYAPHPELYRNPSKAENKKDEIGYVFLRTMAKVLLTPKDVVPSEAIVEYGQSLLDQATSAIKGMSALEKSMALTRMITNISKLSEDKINFEQLNRSLVLFEEYRSGHLPVYKTNSDFFRAISKTEVDLSVVPIPDNETFFIHLQKPINYLSSRVNGAYVVFSKSDGGAVKRVISVTLVDTSGGEAVLGLGGIVATLNLPLLGDTLDESYTSAMAYLPSDQNIEDLEAGYTAIDIVQGFVNCCIYIKSLQPDISHLAPSKDRKEREATAKKHGVSTEEISTVFPVKLLNWSYGKNRTYSVFSTWRDSHLRWQRCGVGRQDVKLIMVEGHNVTFKNAIKKVIESGDKS
jgi:hypothetical protein